MQEHNKSRLSFSSVLRNIFFILLIAQFLPGVVSTVKDSLESVTSSKVSVGYLKIDGKIDNAAFYAKRIEEFEKNEQIKAVLVKIESPGGLPGSSQAIFKELVRLKEKKPVVALVENICASGGYYIAAAADKIVASPSALVGSIGAVSQIPNIKGLLDSWNIKMRYVTAGKFKAVGAAAREMSLEEQQYLQELANDTHQQFIKDVAVSRNISVSNNKVWADGKVFTGNQALKLKLIDEVGSFRDAIAIIKELANIKGEVKLVSIKKKAPGLMRYFVGDEDYSAEYASKVVAAAASRVAASVSQGHNQDMLVI